MRARSVYIKVCDNDSVDIRCGGPDTLGFDFYVSPDENVKDLKKFIRECLSKLNLPCTALFVDRPSEHSIKRLWTRRMIKMCINREGPGMRPIGYR